MKRIRNISGVDQSIVLRGKQLQLGKDSEYDMDDEVANSFLTRCTGLVQEVLDIGGVFDDDIEDVIWIANMTGDPDAADTVGQKVLVGKGSWGTVQVTNPLKEPREIRRMMGGAMVEHMSKAGIEGLNSFAIPVSIPPYQRRKLPTHIGKWFMQRSAMGTPGAVIKSRPKSKDEPDMKWELDDMRMYLQLVDSQAELGPTYKRVKSDISRASKSKNAEEELRKKVRTAKELLMKRLHRRLADPRYRLPSAEEFLEFKAAQVEEEPAAQPSPSANPAA